MRIENRSGHPNWRRLKIAWLFDDISSGTTPSSTNEEYYKDGEIPWVNTGDLTDGKLSSVNKKITRKAIADYPALKVHPKNSLIVALYGATIGKLAITQFDVTTNQACCVLNQPRNINIDFVFYWFLANREGIIQRSVGGGQKNISQGIIRSLRIDVPSLTVQNRIINFLDQKTSEIDTLISDKEKLIALLEEKRQAIITETVTKGLNPDVKMKDSGVEWIGEIPEHWEISSLNLHLKESKTKNIGNKEKNVLSLSYGRIKRRNIKNNFGLLPESFETYRVVKNGDIVLRLTDLQNDKRSLRVGLVKEKGIITSAYLTLVPNQNILSEYASLLLHAYDLKKVFYGFGSGVRQSIGFQELKKLPILLPSKEEQYDICIYLKNFTENIDETLIQLKEQITKLKEYRQSLIYEAVTGKIDIQEMLKETEQEEVSSS
ncbi:restriction endonuclease subunit S [Salinicoccus jeotgali]|uniref:Restriction endonuclease subunit S n=1 Tax=Salinicoccus jeotgali TaxID=381634 RepID=A0ABP7EMX2_9STAP